MIHWVGLREGRKGLPAMDWMAEMRTSSWYTNESNGFISLPTWTRKADVRLLGKGNSNSHGARPVHLIITMIRWLEEREQQLHLLAHLESAHVFESILIRVEG